MIYLKPCPFCGSKNVKDFHKWQGTNPSEGSWDKPAKKYCEDCGAKMDGGEINES